MSILMFGETTANTCIYKQIVVACSPDSTFNSDGYTLTIKPDCFFVTH